MPAMGCPKIAYRAASKPVLRCVWNAQKQGKIHVNCYDYGARFYDPVIGRFTGLDPIAEDYYYVTPYNYAENRPIDCVDLWGLQAVRYSAPIVQYNRRPANAGSIRNTRYSPMTNMRTKVNIQYFEPYSIPGGSSYTDPQFTRNNFSGQVVSAGIEGIANHLEGIDVQTVKINGESSTNYNFNFSSIEVNDSFNKAQLNYESTFNARVATLSEPVRPGDGATSEEWSQYTKDVAAYSVQKDAIKIDMGLSPKESLIEFFKQNVNDFQIIKDNTENLPVYYETFSISN